MVDLDLVSAAINRLAQFPDFQELVLEGLIGTDADDTATDLEKLGKAWLFQGLTDDGRPYRDPEGSGTSVIVLSERTEWTAPNQHNTAYFPRLQMLIYTDSDRDESGAVTLLNASAKCKHIFRALDRCFHLVQNEESDQIWPGGKWVHSSLRAGGFDIRDVPQTQSSTVRGEALYNTITD